MASLDQDHDQASGQAMAAGRLWQHLGQLHPDGAAPTDGVGSPGAAGDSWQPGHHLVEVVPVDRR
jgi:hypothetical protein